MKAEIEKKFPDSEVELIESSGGRFEVRSGEKLLFSKKQTGRFPEPEEIFAALAA